MGEQAIYYKATMNGGASQHTPTIYYKIGLNVHPFPNKQDTNECGVGIHIAMTLTSAKRYVPNATEFYTCRPGVILGEGLDKLRCSYIWIDKKLSPEEIEQVINQENAEKEKREAEFREKEKVRKALQKEQQEREEKFRKATANPLCGADWVKAHFDDHSQMEIDSLGMEIITDKRHITIKGTSKKGVIRKVLSAVSG